MSNQELLPEDYQKIVELIRAANPDSRNLGYALMAAHTEDVQYERAAALLFESYKSGGYEFYHSLPEYELMYEWLIAKRLHNNFAMPNYLSLSVAASKTFTGLAEERLWWEKMNCFEVEEIMFEPTIFIHALPSLKQMPNDYAFWFLLSIGIFDRGTEDNFGVRNTAIDSYIEPAFVDFFPAQAHPFMDSVLTHYKSIIKNNLAINQHFLSYLQRFNVLPEWEALLLYWKGDLAGAVSVWEQKVLINEPYTNLFKVDKHQNYFRWKYEQLVGNEAQELIWMEYLNTYFNNYYGSYKPVYGDSTPENLSLYYFVESEKYEFAAKIMSDAGAPGMAARYKEKDVAIDAERDLLSNYMSLLLAENSDSVALSLSMFEGQPDIFKNYLHPVLVMLELLYYEQNKTIFTAANQLLQNFPAKKTDALRQCFAPIAWGYVHNVTAYAEGGLSHILDIYLQQYYSEVFDFETAKVDDTNIQFFEPFWSKMEEKGAWFYLYIAPVYDTLAAVCYDYSDKYKFEKITHYRPILQDVIYEHYYQSFQALPLFKILKKFDKNIKLQAKLLHECHREEEAVKLVEEKMLATEWFEEYFLWKYKMLNSDLVFDAKREEKVMAAWFEQLLQHSKEYHSYHASKEEFAYKKALELAAEYCQKLSLPEMALNYKYQFYTAAGIKMPPIKKSYDAADIQLLEYALYTKLSGKQKEQLYQHIWHCIMNQPNTIRQLYLPLVLIWQFEEYPHSESALRKYVNPALLAPWLSFFELTGLKAKQTELSAGAVSFWPNILKQEPAVVWAALEPLIGAVLPYWNNSQDGSLMAIIMGHYFADYPEYEAQALFCLRQGRANCSFYWETANITYIKLRISYDFEQGACLEELPNLIQELKKQEGSTATWRALRPLVEKLEALLLKENI